MSDPHATSIAVLEERIKALEDALAAALIAQEKAVAAALAAAEKAVQAALVAAEKAVSAAFAASEKAVLKAEEAQKEYNIRSNEFRGQLDDQAKTLMPRPETMTMFKATDDKLTGIKVEIEKKIDLMRLDIQGISGLITTAGGRAEGVHASWGLVTGAAAFVLVLLGIAAYMMAVLKR